LVINPDDYGQTVENIFYASFLIKEGQAGIQVDDDGQVIIRMFSLIECLEDDLTIQVMSWIGRGMRMRMYRKIKRL
jgi:hypothetical protein